MRPPAVRYADLVFHVLSHVRPRAPLNASLYNAKYVQFCEAFLGAAESRALGEDAEVLARLLSNHQALARVQILAWLFDSAEEASHWDACELADFPEVGTFRSDVRDRLLGDGRAALELLRCAVALEAEKYALLPAEDRAVEVQLRERLRALHAVAPRLEGAEVVCCRALGTRGRALGDTIFVGLPEPAPHAPSEQHAALQAAHEATVREVSQAQGMPFLQTEHAALTLLRVRMRGHAHEEAHKRWLTSLNLSQFGGLGGVDLARLEEAPRSVVEGLLEETA